MQHNLYHKIYLNPFLGAILIEEFLKGFNKKISLKLAFTILPLFFDENIFKGTIKSRATTTFFTLVGKESLIEIKKQILFKKILSSQSIIIGIKNKRLHLEKDGLSFLNDNLKIKSDETKKICRQIRTLGKILAKLKSEEDIFYYIYNF